MKNFIVKKNKFKKTEKQPDYIVSFNDGEKWQIWGACWLKEGQDGQFLSCTQSKPKPEEEEKVAEVLPENMPF